MAPALAAAALSLAARWATTKRKLDATDDASEPSPRKRVAVTLEPPSTSLDILDLAVLRRLSDEHGPTHPDHDASSPGGDETTPFEVEPMEADVDHDELLHRPSNKRVRDPADDFLRDPLDADHPSFGFPARGVTAPRSPAPASGAPTAGTLGRPSREEPPAPPPNSQGARRVIECVAYEGIRRRGRGRKRRDYPHRFLDDAASARAPSVMAFFLDVPRARGPWTTKSAANSASGQSGHGPRHGALPAPPRLSPPRVPMKDGSDGGSLTLHDITGRARARARARV